jgi:cytochrome b involved in lipid metabolism
MPCCTTHASNASSVLTRTWYVHACTNTATRCKRKSNRLKREQLVGMPTYTMEFFNDRVLQGEKWVIVNSAVVDVKDYMKVHPGGSKVLAHTLLSVLLLVRLYVIAKHA